MPHSSGDTTAAKDVQFSLLFLLLQIPGGGFSSPFFKTLLSLFYFLPFAFHLKLKLRMPSKVTRADLDSVL